MSDGEDKLVESILHLWLLAACIFTVQFLCALTPWVDMGMWAFWPFIPMTVFHVGAFVIGCIVLLTDRIGGE
jgi:hypothetical protein